MSQKTRRSTRQVQGRMLRRVRLWIQANRGIFGARLRPWGPDIVFFFFCRNEGDSHPENIVSREGAKRICLSRHNPFPYDCSANFEPVNLFGQREIEVRRGSRKRALNSLLLGSRRSRGVNERTVSAHCSNEVRYKGRKRRVKEARAAAHPDWPCVPIYSSPLVAKTNSKRAKS